MSRTAPPALAVAREFGRIMQETRVRRGLTQRELAILVGIGYSTVTHYEQGARSPAWDTLLRISRALDTPLSILLAPLDDYRLDDVPATPRRRRRVWRYVEAEDDG